MAATLRDVAAQAGVSIKTVSNVVHDFPHIRQSTRERVLAAIDELGYKPNITARSLRSGRTGVIGLALPQLSQSYFGELADAVIQAAERRNLVVLVEQTGGDRDRELSMLTSARLQLVDGLIFSPLGLAADDAAQLRVPYPMVLLGERVFDAPVDHVAMRNVDAARAATRHLLERGCRRIAVIGAEAGDVPGSASLRLQGYREALAEAGVPFDAALLGRVQRWDRADAAAVMRRMLAAGTPVDGVFGFTDTLALGAMREVQAAGLRIPEDVAVIGFDSIDETLYSLPPLSTIDPGRADIAETAVGLLADRIGGGAAPAAPVLHLMDYAVLARDSTAAQ